MEKFSKRVKAAPKNEQHYIQNLEFLEQQNADIKKENNRLYDENIKLIKMLEESDALIACLTKELSAYHSALKDIVTSGKKYN